MKRFLFAGSLLAALLGFAVSGHAQSLSNYVFTSTSTTYTSIIGQGGTTLIFDPGVNTTDDDGYYTGVPIGFNFSYLGTTYSTVATCANGFALLGGTTVSGSSWVPDLSGTSGSSGRPVLAPFWSDMQLIAGAGGSSHGYRTDGSAPNRVFTLEWNKSEWTYTTGVLSVSFQIKLYEASGTVEFLYNQEATQPSTQTVGIGITAAGTGAGSYWAVQDNNFNTVSGTATGSVTARPASGTRLSWVPMSTTLSTPTSFAATNVASSSMTVSWTNNAASAYAGAVYISTDNTNFTWKGFTAMNGTGTYSFNVTGLTGNTTYYYRIYAVSSAGTSAPLSGSQATASGTLSGVRQIPTASYPTIKSAIDSLNAYGLAGSITFELLSTYTSTAETYPLVFGAVAGSSQSNVVTFRPASDVASVLNITGSNATALIQFNGAKYVRFDGRPGGNGTSSMVNIENTLVGSSATIRFTGDASYDTVRYCTLRSANNVTTSGTVFFGSPSINGNSYNSIANCTIREITSGSTPACAVYISGSSTAVSTNNSLLNNNIVNFAGTSTVYGIYASSSYTNNWTISGNSFYQTAARTFASTFAFIYMAETGGVSGLGNVISNNYFGGTGPGCSGTPWTATHSSTWYGLYLPGTSANSGNRTISGNTMTNLAITTSSTSFYPIYAYNTNLTINNNTIGSSSATGAITLTYSGTGTVTVYSIYGYPASSLGQNINVNNNVIGGITCSATSTGGFAFNGIYIGSTIGGSTSTASNNVIGSPTVANSITLPATSGVASYFRGFYVASGSGSFAMTFDNNTVANVVNNSTYATAGGSYTFAFFGASGIHNITNNSFYNLTSANNNTSNTNTTMCLVGINEASSTAPSGLNGHTISGNKIYNLFNSNAAAASNWLVGMAVAGSSASSKVLIEKNFVHSFNFQSTSANVIVPILTYTIPAFVVNNNVRMGIDASGASITNPASIYGIYKNGTLPATIANNSVYIGGSNVTGTSNTFCLWRNGLPASGFDNIRNNIMQNARTNGSGTGAHVCLLVGNSSATTAAIATSALLLNNNLYYHNGAGGFIGGIQVLTTINAYSTMQAWSGASSQDGASGYALPNFVYPAGTSSNVNLHISGTTAARGGGVPISGVSDDYDGESRPATFSDIGSDQCASCNANDIFAPTITYTAFSNGISESARTVGGVVVSDYSGVNTTSGTRPRIYFKKSSDLNQFVGNTTTDNGWKWVEATNTSSPFSFTINYGLLQSAVSVGDTVQYFVIAQDVVGTPNVGVNACAFTSYPSSVNIANSSFPAGNFRSYLISSTISGAVNVGPAEAITSLTNTGGLFDLINSRVVVGNLNVTITGNLTAESGTVALNQTAEYGTGNYTITIRPSAGAPDTVSGSYAGGLIRLNGADRVIIDGRPDASSTARMLTFINTATTGTVATIQLISQGTGLGCVSDTIRYCNIRSGLRTNTTAYLVASGGTTINTAGDDNDKFALMNNYLGCSYFGVRIIGTGAGVHDSINVSGNLFSWPGSSTPINDTLGNTSLLISYSSVSTVRDNIFRDIAHQATTVPVISFDNDQYMNFERNTLDNIGGFSSSAYNVIGMTIGSSVRDSRFVRNTLNNICYRSTGGWYAYAMNVNTGLTNSNLVIANNVFSTIAHDYLTGTSYVSNGLRLSTTGGVKVYNNSFLLRGPFFNTTSAASSYCVMILTGCSNLELVNNIFSNRMYGFTGSKAYGLYLGATGQLSVNDYNVYDVTLGTTQGVIASFNGTDVTTIPSLRTTIGGEANSMAIPVMYKDSSATTDLHLTKQEPTLRGSSAVSSAITTDFDGNTRTRYLIGADEVTPVMNISQQPSSATKCEGEAFTLSSALTTPVTFDDGVSRTSTITYQWYKGSSAISGATDASYTVSASTTADAGNYTVRIFSSSIDSVVSNTAVVTINTLPNITQQPSDVSRCLGTLTTLSGAATGTGITYQWQKQNGASWSNISGANSSTYTIPSMTAGDYGSYRFVVTGTCTPAATSNTATITQLSSTSISVQPSATPSSVCSGGSFTLSVTATASNIGYQWRRNGVSISGATNSSFTVTNAQLSDFATYSVAVSGDCGVVISNNVAVTQIAPTSITSQPSTTTPQVCLGAPFTITMSASGASLSYQWLRNGTNISGATNSSYSVAAATLADFASYTVSVTGTCGTVNSQTVTIVQIPSTVINTQPVATTTLCSGGTVSLSVSAAGANLSYQWQKQSGASFNAISGATASTYTIGSVAPTDAGTYRVVVTGTCGAVNSSNSVLVVNTPVSITAQPSWSFPNACTGETTTISMSASGTITSYQWQKFDGSTWQNVSGATSNSYTIASLVLADAGGYRIQLDGPCSPTSFSNQATLTVQQNVQVNSQPSPQTACVGSSISFSVTTIGTVVGYQWEQDRLRNGSWTNIPGATSATYTKSGVTAADSGLYRVKVTGNCSAIPVTSSSASATIQSIYNITSQPSWPATPTNVGTVVSLSVGFTGSANFQWQRDQQRSGNWVNVGTNSPLYSYTVTSVADSGNYRCVVSGPCGAVTQNTNIVAVYTCQPPVVTNQPATPQPVCAGGALSLNVGVNSNGQAVSYQWQLDASRTGSFTNIPGATNASYIKTNVQTSDDGMYRVQVTSACAVTPVYSNAVSFVVLSANLVLSHPSSATVCGGSNVTMSVSAGGASPAYQWFYNGAPMNVGQNPTAQTANLQLSNVTPGMAGSYRCFVTGPCSPNGVFSNIATLTVNSPVMQLQPQSQTGCVGTPVTFNVQVSGSGLAYQWRKNSVAIAGATNASYTIASSVVADAGTYSVVTSNTCGTVTSSNAVLTMTVPAAFTSQPSSQSICRGSNLTLSVGINSDATTPTYQWRLNGNNLPLSAYPSANTPVLTINNIQTTEAGSYTCSVVTPCQPLGTLSAAAVVTVNPNTSISQQPSGTTVCEGNPVTFVVGAGGVSLGYQWLKDGAPIAGATNSIYIITNTVGSDNGNYAAVVSGTCAPTPITSNAATLVVNTNPRITAAPVADRAACQGSTVSFTTGASGTGLVYRWRFNGSTITGNASASTPTLVVTGITGANAGAYDCVITGSCSTTGVTTNAGILTINTPVSISSQPASQVVCSRADVVFTVANAGTGAVYQWRYNGASINGNPSAVTNQLTLTGVSTANAGLYDVVISGTCNVVTSVPAILTVQNVLSITSQPEPSRICAGSTLQATVAATGTILGYQWQKDGVNIPGQNSATLTIAGASVAQSGGYRCVISGSSACGTALQVSNTVEMIVGTAATITKQPSNVAVSFGSTVSAQVDASGLGYGVNNTLQYSWFKGSTRLADGSRFSGTGTSVLTIRGVQPSDIGNDYYVVVSGVCGNTTSNQFALFVPAVNITGQPQAAELCAGQSTVFSVVAVPNPSTSQLSYQWFRGTTRLNDGPNVTGSATSSMTVSNVSATDAGDYTCEITVQPGGSRVTSSIAKLTVNTQPSITAQPADQAVCDGSALNLSVTGAGGSLQYQWKKGGTDISGATASSYTVSASSAADAGTYTVTVRNGCGTVTSQSVTVSISTKPTITTQPTATQTVVVGGTLTLSTTATGSGTLKYQWKLNGNAIAGATNATYTKSPASKNDEGTYVCEVTNDCGAASTSNAVVSISTTSITDAEVYGYMLGTPEPNPMGEVASLKVRVPLSGAVRLDLSDMSGRVVATLIDGVLDAGEHTEVLSASRNNLGSGVYTLRLVTSEGYVTTKRLVIVR